jgi:hypothetical protein
MKFILIIAFLFCIGTVANAQSPFKAEPLLQYRALSVRSMALSTVPAAISPLPSVTQADSIVNAWRFTANISPGGYTFNGTYQVMAGAEFGWQHQSYSYATQTYTVIYSINAAWFPINSANGFTSLSGISSVAALFGFDNNLIQFGPMYNPNAPANQKWGVCAVIGITLNN